MPKRKKTRQNHVKAKRPMLPDGDLDNSMSLDERKQKLDVYLHDFDLQVKERVKKMKAQSHNLICKIKGAFTLEIMRLPTNIRKMTLKEYLAEGGEVDNAALSEASKLVSDMTNSIFQSTASGRPVFNGVGNTLTPMLQTPAQALGKTAKNMTENENNAVVSSTTSTRSTRSKKRIASPSSTLGRHTRSKLPKVQEDIMLPPTAPPPSTGRRSRRIQSKALATPATYGGKHPSFNTPAVTPKFDPRLPMTPFLREAKPGERIMSLTGSPVVNHTEPASGAHMYVPLGDGTTFHLNTEANISPSQGTALNDVARRNLELLQKQLTMLLKVPPGLKTK